MAAAALLRSMARKLARAPTPTPATAHPRPLLAGGLHGGARSCHGSSLRPLTSYQIRQGSGDKMAVGMGVAAAAGLRSSLATKIARAPQQHHRRLFNRGLHSGSTAPSTSDKDKKVIEDLRSQLWHARTATRVTCVALGGVTMYLYFWLVPKARKMRDRLMAFEKLEHELREVMRAEEDVTRSAALAQIIQTSGHKKQQCNGTTDTEKGTRFEKIADEVVQICFDLLNETAAASRSPGLDDDIRADLKECRAAADRMRSRRKGAAAARRVGSQTASSS